MCTTVDEGTPFDPNSFRRITSLVSSGGPVSLDSQDKYLGHFALIYAYDGREPVYGMSSVDGKWKIYLRWTISFSVSAQTATYTATLYKVENDGTPTAIGGPYELVARRGVDKLKNLFVVCVYDETTNEISFSWYPEQETNSSTMPWNPPTAYPSICVAERLKDDEDKYVSMRCPYAGVYAGGMSMAGWAARLCVCDGALIAPNWFQGTTPRGQKYSKWPAGIQGTFSGITSPWDDYYGNNELNGDHDFGSYVAVYGPATNSVCLHICKREIIIYSPIFGPSVVFTSHMGLNLSLASEYDSVADETTITMSGYVNTPGGYLSGAYWGSGYFSQAISFSKVFAGDKDVRLLDDDLDLDAWGAGPWDFSNSTLHLTTIHP